MSVQYLDSPSVPLTYEQITQWAIDVNSSQGYNVNEYLSYINANYPNADLSEFMIEQTDRVFDYVQNGDGTYTVLGYRTPIQDTVMSDPFNSNTSTISRGTIRQAINDGVKDVGGVITRNMTTFPASGSFAQQASYIIGSVGSAVAAVSTGITLGKLIDSALYNANPNYWDSIGMETLNPETWNTITNGDDSPFAGLFNLIMGLDPNTGNSQMYMDQNALAYMAYVLAQNGWFTTGSGYTCNSSPDTPDIQTPFSFGDATFSCTYFSNTWDMRIQNNASPVYCVMIPTSNNPNSYIYHLVSKNSFQYSFRPSSSSTNNWNNASTETYNNVTYYTYSGGSVTNPSIPTYPVHTAYDEQLEYAILFGNVSEIRPIDGVSNQTDATLPSIADWTDIPSTLNSLQSQYPDMFNDAISFDNIQPDGTVNRSTYVPVAMPSFNYNNDKQPISGSQSQSQTQYNPTTTDSNILQLLTNVLTSTKTETNSEPETPPINPVDTGIGSSPTPVAPTGSASALWSVYHPTQAQINSFGAWLWGSPFLTDIGKLFQNPIDGVISLHKIYATPVDSGTGNIVVGTLDSQVSSATVNQQYIEVDCGYVDCHEYFGNVFDYSPYTKVSLYLPFIGIVPLNISDIMRSTIHIVYGVDVFTGACIAMVKVSRDGNSINLYQYTGNCAVHYPLSNVQQSQLLSGLISIAAGVGSVLATGGASAPAAIGIVSGMASSAHTSIGRSGGFSANAGAMGIKVPYLIVERPQPKLADTFPRLAGYPTNYSCKLGDCSNHVVVKHVHVEGIPATDTELAQIESLLKDGVLI